MNMRANLLIVLTGICLLMLRAEVASARPDYGSNCAACHDTDRDDAFAVTNYDALINLDSDNLVTAVDRGFLANFNVEAGSTVSLSLDVLNGANVYALSLSGFGGGGVMNDASNMLVFSGDSSWTDQGGYFTLDAGNGTDGIAWGGATATYSFDLFVDSSTPLDTYDLQFAIGGTGGGLWSGVEHVYVTVVPEPASWLLFTGLMSVGGAVWFWRRRKD